MRKRRQRFTLYRLPGDPVGRFRRLAIVRRVLAIRYLDRVYGHGHYTLLEAPS